MFPSDLIRHKDPEIFLALAAPLGADVNKVCEVLEEALKAFNYKLKSIRVIEELEQFSGFLVTKSNREDEKIKSRMDDGDKFRKLVKRNDALAILSISAVRRFRRENNSKDKPRTRQAYLFRSLKRPEEVTALRRIYGSNLIVIGVHSSREQRVNHLSERIMKSYYSAQRDKYRDKAEKLIIRDESDESQDYGQRLRPTFALADFFLDAGNPQSLRPDIDRLLQILFNKPVVTPTRDEVGMAHAFLAAMRSAELGRQVGAAICDRNGSLISVGTNEVPKARGGYYWDSDTYDERDWRKGRDSSDAFKNSSLGELLQALSSKRWLSAPVSKLTTSQQISMLAPLIKMTRYMQLIEFVRAVHGEMSAIVDAASRGASIAGCTMYVTTFPCHECARHIVASGIERVVYIEPYAKSLALELHGDSIQLDITGDEHRIPFMPFLGVAPRNHTNMFTMGDRKRSDGQLIAWNPTVANPRVSGSFWSYLRYEEEDLTFLIEDLKKQGLKLKKS